LALLSVHGSASMIVLLNSPVITSDGTYRYRTISAAEARRLVAAEDWLSAISHSDTAVIVARELGIDCKPNPIVWHQAVGERAIVFRVMPRRGETTSRSREQLEGEGYSWGLLERLA
jgi:hypothetical protein